MSTQIPIIVGGCHRSGTSLVRRLLNAHSNIFCGPEVKFLRDFHNEYPADPLSHVRFTTSARSILGEQELLEILGKSYIDILNKATKNARKLRWAEKCPENIIHLEDWQVLLKDNWVFIHVVRNPLDVLASMSEVNFPIALPESLNERIDFWIKYNQSGINFFNSNPSRYFVLHYEELVTKPIPTLKLLMPWLGETYQEQQLSFNSQPQAIGLEDPKISLTNSIHFHSLNKWESKFNANEANLIRSKTKSTWEAISQISKSHI